MPAKYKLTVSNLNLKETYMLSKTLLLSLLAHKTRALNITPGFLGNLGTTWILEMCQTAF